MAEWSVKPEWKKSVIERNYLTKDGNTVMVETGWRWGEFIVTTEDDNPPKLESGVDMFSCGYDSEMVETFDGCWEEIDYDDVSDETREWLEEFFEEGNSYYDLEEHGWYFDDTEMIIDCDLVIRKVNEDGSLDDPIQVETDEEEAAELQEYVDNHNKNVALNQQAKWPFEMPKEGPQETQYAQFVCEDCGYSTEDIMDLADSDDESKGAFMCPECGGKVSL